MLQFDEYLVEKRKLKLRGTLVGLPVAVVSAASTFTSGLILHPNFLDIDASSISCVAPPVPASTWPHALLVSFRRGLDPLFTLGLASGLVGITTFKITAALFRVIWRQANRNTAHMIDAVRYPHTYHFIM
jgi:hypothetical protein